MLFAKTQKTQPMTVVNVSVSGEVLSPMHPETYHVEEGSAPNEYIMRVVLPDTAELKLVGKHVVIGTEVRLITGAMNEPLLGTNLSSIRFIAVPTPIRAIDVRPLQLTRS